MKTLYESILDVDTNIGLANAAAGWVEKITWSRSDIKNFIFKQLWGRVIFDGAKNDNIKVDDYVACNHLIRYDGQNQYTNDYNNKRTDQTFEYRVKCLKRDMESLDFAADLKKIRTKPTICKVTNERSNTYFRFRVRCGCDDETVTPQVVMSKYYWPKSDGDWIIHLCVKKGMNDCSTTPVTKFNTNFDGHIPSKQLK